MTRFAPGQLGKGAAAVLMAVGLGASSPGCERRSEPAPRPAVGDASAARELATPGAFALEPSPGGAVLAWASSGGELALMRFGGDGLPAEGGAALTRVAGVGPGVVDLALVATDAGVGLAWSEPGPASATEGVLRAAWLPAEGDARTYELGAAFRSDGTRRGAIALAPRARGALLLARGLPASCADARERECSAFQFFELGPDLARATGLGLSVPSPCAAHSVQLVAAQPSPAGAGPFEYAICAGPAGATALTVFSIQPNPAYAAAEEALAGCEPLGAGRFGGEATFVGVCAGRRRSVSIPAEGGALVVRDLDQRGLICNAGGARLRFGSGWLRPNEPLGHLELLLNDDLAPPEARAVWTGSALLVAEVRDGRLSVLRHGCRGAQLVELESAREIGAELETHVR